MSALMVCLFATVSAIAQNDTMYIMKKGTVIGKFNIKTDVDSVVFYKPVSASTSQTGTFTDARDGNVYRTVTIGTQVWMAENLRYLPSVANLASGSQTTAYYYVYDYDGTSVEAAKATTNYKTYGVLYNWSAAVAGSASSTANPSGVQGACPVGWHLPSDAEWTQLTSYLGGESVAAGKLKEAGTSHWKTPNTDASNESGFSALPGGYRYNYLYYKEIGEVGTWWSATDSFSVSAMYRNMYYDRGYTFANYFNKSFGMSVRCVKD